MNPPRPPSPWGPLLRVALYAAGLFAMAEVTMFRLPAEDGWALFGEYGRLERVQVGLLVLGMVLALFAAWRYAPSRPLSILFLGLLAAVLVREHNNYFKDHHFRGLWQILVTGVLAVAAGCAWPSRRRLIPALADLVRRPAFGWLAGAALLVVFAQLLDERKIWVLLLGEDFPYAARRMAEESVEMAAYYLLAIGLVEYVLGQRRPPDVAP